MDVIGRTYWVCILNSTHIVIRRGLHRCGSTLSNLIPHGGGVCVRGMGLGKWRQYSILRCFEAAWKRKSTSCGADHTVKLVRLPLVET